MYFFFLLLFSCYISSGYSYACKNNYYYGGVFLYNSITQMANCNPTYYDCGCPGNRHSYYMSKYTHSKGCNAYYRNYLYYYSDCRGNSLGSGNWIDSFMIQTITRTGVKIYTAHTYYWRSLRTQVYEYACNSKTCLCGYKGRRYSGTLYTAAAFQYVLQYDNWASSWGCSSSWYKDGWISIATTKTFYVHRMPIPYLPKYGCHVSWDALKYKADQVSACTLSNIRDCGCNTAYTESNVILLSVVRDQSKFCKYTYQISGASRRDCDSRYYGSYPVVHTILQVQPNIDIFAESGASVKGPDSKTCMNGVKFVGKGTFTVYTIPKNTHKCCYGQGWYSMVSSVARSMGVTNFAITGSGNCPATLPTPAPTGTTGSPTVPTVSPTPAPTGVTPLPTNSTLVPTDPPTGETPVPTDETLIKKACRNGTNARSGGMCVGGPTLCQGSHVQGCYCLNSDCKTIKNVCWACCFANITLHNIDQYQVAAGKCITKNPTPIPTHPTTIPTPEPTPKPTSHPVTPRPTPNPTKDFVCNMVLGASKSQCRLQCPQETRKSCVCAPNPNNPNQKKCFKDKVCYACCKLLSIGANLERTAIRNDECKENNSGFGAQVGYKEVTFGDVVFDGDSWSFKSPLASFINWTMLICLISCGIACYCGVKKYQKNRTERSMENEELMSDIGGNNVEMKSDN